MLAKRRRCLNVDRRKRVLIVSTAFPPQIGSAVRRLCAFVKHLPRFGWDPYVLMRVVA